ncbi:hypothetical protein A3F55_02585 [Candidatus Adlerbacteria bacterium RIFCSPHIGHO2_12_FULL_53_18]|uniref:Uncharacterized protein n=1 Tax=Candidatus Adlerbacteria bacterium RIFCSPHIGHO2_12_FULL_53_18 TaxID=1797242 RepID=A0A1F4XUJ8_9BACT|nr:MAG: hypothetical protein A3F55_02585 [Candidatus Adlerbacteria bacterium RIFCSPHIGHO2_12_FULL_53_18]
MRRYIENIQDTHTPHERRQVAMRIAAIVTGLLFIAWLATLGVRLGGAVPAVVNEGTSNAASALEAVQE